MIKHKLYYQKSLFSSSSDLCIWDENGNQYVYDIIYAQQGTRTDLLQFTILPSKRKTIGNIDPDIRHIVFIELPSGARLPFMVVKTQEDIYGNLIVFCASQGYLMNTITVAYWNSGNINWKVKRKIHGHLREMMEYTITEQEKGTTCPFSPYTFVASQMNADGETTIEMPSYEDSFTKTLADIFDKMASDCNYGVRRVSSEFSSVTKKWSDSLAVGSASDLASKRVTYTYTDMSVFTSFKKTKCLDDCYNGSYVYSDTGWETYKRRGPGKIEHLLFYKFEDPGGLTETDVRNTCNEIYATTTGNDWIKSEIEVNPIMIEPSTRYIRMYDTLTFQDCGVATGSYIVTGITRYIDSPDKTKFKLTQA